MGARASWRPTEVKVQVLLAAVCSATCSCSGKIVRIAAAINPVFVAEVTMLISGWSWSEESLSISVNE